LEFHEIHTEMWISAVNISHAKHVIFPKDQRRQCWSPDSNSSTVL